MTAGPVKATISDWTTTSSSIMKLSIVVPAFNEEKLITRSLASIRAALDANARPDLDTELIVVDNNSTDRTAELAREAGAKVCFEPINQIGRARNRGAGTANGDWILFIDADSFPTPALLSEIVALMDQDEVVGCGCLVRMDVPFVGRLIVGLWNRVSAILRWAAGSFILTRADAFREIGGFDQELYASEEINFSRRLKRWGKRHGKSFVILRDHPLDTSNRKLQLYGQREILRHFFRLALRPRKALRDKKYLDIWYDGRR